MRATGPLEKRAHHEETIGPRNALPPMGKAAIGDNEENIHLMD